MRSRSGSDGRAPRATMVDVAQASGVSLKTVSRVINGESGVRPQTVEKVLEAASGLRYERNDLAASLRHGTRSFTVGLVIEDVANPFYSAIAQAVEESARQRDSLLITSSAREDPARERELVKALLRRRVDALLLVPAATDHRYIAEAGFQGRTVFVDRPPARTRADTVLTDNRASARRAVDHLIAAGHRRIAFIGDDLRLYTARERLVGYRQALQAAGLPVDQALICTESSTSGAARTATTRLLAQRPDSRPTAIFAGNNRCAVGALQVLGTRRRRVAIVGFDDFELAELLDLTVVRTDPYRMGQVAAELAFGRMDGDRRRPQRVVIPGELIRRGSGELRPA